MSEDQWALGIIHEVTDPLWSREHQPTPQWIESPPGRFLADPFAVCHDGCYYLFCEEWDFSTRRGRIVVLESEDLRVFGRPRTALERPFHLSYPFVFQYRDEWYCLPEQYQANNVALYRAMRFPYCWEESDILLPDFPGIDPTVFHQNGFWWMLVGRLGGDWREPADTIHLFSADELRGPWTPHPINPVVNRPFRARSGGRVLMLNGRLIRPVQDSMNTYGEGLLFYEIDTINCEEYAEHQVGAWSKCSAWPYNRGLHHIELIGGKVIIDAKR